MHSRIERINELLKETVGNLLLEELDTSPGVFVTITRVDTSKDLRYAKVFLSVFPEKHFGKILERVKKQSYRIQGAMNRKLSLKPLPRLEFLRDTTEVEASEIEEILRQI